MRLTLIRPDNNNDPLLGIDTKMVIKVAVDLVVALVVKEDFMEV